MKKALLIVFLVMALGAFGWGIYKLVGPKLNAENRQIDRWITANNLNSYGDPENTAYSGGTPLFDEATGGKIDRYDYIKRMHSDKPWEK